MVLISQESGYLWVGTEKWQNGYFQDADNALFPEEGEVP